MEFSAVVRHRRMVRAFQPSPLEAGKLLSLLQNAHRAPSAGHLEPQEFVLVKDTPTKRRLAQAALGQEFIAQAPLVLVVCADARRNVWRYGQRGRDFYCVIDGAFASLLILLAAVDEGLGACFVGAFDDRQVARVLGLPPEVRPIGIIPVGYPAEAPERLGRRPLQEKVHLERWDNRLSPELSLLEALQAWLTGEEKRVS